MSELIAVPTFQRIGMLGDCLDSIIPLLNHEDEILVLDNDPLRSAEESICTLRSRFSNINYIHVPEPGVTAVRNIAVEYARKSSHFAILFIDDDEVACANWLKAHQRTSESYNSTITIGPVRPSYVQETKRIVSTLDYFSRPDSQDGRFPNWLGTGNARMSIDFLRANPTLRFEDKYSKSGGEDTAFFRRARSLGATICWSSNALVRETVPIERTRASWIWSRAVRLGQLSAHFMREDGKGFLPVLAIAVLRSLAAAPLALLAALRGRPAGPALLNFPKGLGMVRYLRSSTILSAYGSHRDQSGRSEQSGPSNEVSS